MKISIPDFDAEIVYKGNEAKNIYNKMLNEDMETLIRKIVNLACRTTRIGTATIYSSIRKPEAVFARYCVFWYFNKYHKFSLKECGQIFSQDHATALHGIKDYNLEDRYQKNERVKWRERFVDLLKSQRQTGDSDIFNRELTK